MQQSTSFAVPAPLVVVVTGASSGIGHATALALARRGATLVLAARGAARLHSAAVACRDLGAQVTEAACDVRSSAAMTDLVAQTVARHGRIDAWVHSAAVMAYGTVEQVPPEVFDTVIATNLLGTANAARAVLPQFRVQEAGTFVALGSLLDSTTAPLMGAYATGKWGQKGLLRVLRQETRGRRARNIHICTVAPAGVRTPIYTDAATYAGHLGSPPPPVASPDRVAAAVLSCLDRPRRLVTVGPNRIIRLGFGAMPAVYDLLVGPLLTVFGLARARTGATTGTVLAPRED